MAIFEVTVELTFEADAPTSTEAKGRLLQDLKIHKIMAGADLAAGLVYKRKSIAKCKMKREGRG